MIAAPKKTSVSSSYLKLIRQFPLRPIPDQKQYDVAIGVMEKLAVLGEKNLDAGQQDYLNALDEFISLFDRGHFKFEDKRTPLQRLQYVLAESATSPAELKKILDCSQSLVSMILSGVRELSKENIRALADHFKVDAGLFL